MKKNKFKLLLILGYLILIFQLVIFIMIGTKSLINSDSTFIVDYSAEIIRTGKLFPKLWVNTNDFWIYSLIPFITIFLKIGLKFYMSRQLAVLLQSILIFVFMYDISKNTTKNKKNNLFSISALLILSGITGQFAFEVFGDATYGTIILFMLIAVDIFIRYISTKKIIYPIIMSFIFIFLNSCSLRFPIYICAPLIVCCLYLIYENGFKKEYIIEFFSIVLSIGVGYFFNKYLSEHLILLSYTNKPIIGSSSEVIESISSIIFNYMTLAGATNTGVFSLTTCKTNEFIQTTSPFILIAFIKNIFALVTFLLPFILLKKFNKMLENEKILYIFISSLFIILFFFLFVGKMYTWYRYITPVLFFLILLYPLLYKYYFSNNLKNKIVFLIYMFLCISTSFVLVVSSYIDKTGLRQNKYQKITDFLVSKKLNFGYTNSVTEHTLYRTLSDNKLQIIRINPDTLQPNKWLNSGDWYKEEYYTGKVFYIRNKNDAPLSIEKKAIKIYEFDDNNIIVFNDNRIFTDNFNVGDFKPQISDSN